MPPELRDEIRCEVIAARRVATILELRPPWPGGSGHEWTAQPVARLSLEPTGLWSLCWYRRERWVRFEKAPTRTVHPLLRTVEANPYGVFWG